MESGQAGSVITTQVFRVQPVINGTQVTRTEYVRTEYPTGNSTTTSKVYSYTIYTAQARVETGPHWSQVDALT